MLCINDIFSLIDSPQISLILYADDGTCFVRVHNLDAAVNTAKNCLENIHQWFQSNKLKLNTSETKSSILTNRFANRYTLTELQADTITIKRVNQFKLLGVIADELMT